MYPRCPALLGLLKFCNAVSRENHGLPLPSTFRVNRDIRLMRVIKVVMDSRVIGVITAIKVVMDIRVIGVITAIKVVVRVIRVQR
jgi:hypothetical protein